MSTSSAPAVSWITGARALGARIKGLKDVLQRMIVPQLVELDIFLEAFERGVARELLEPGDVDAGGDAA